MPGLGWMFTGDWLPALWFAFAFVGSLINGKDYSHYLLQTFPPLVLLLAPRPPVSNTGTFDRNFLR